MNAGVGTLVAITGVRDPLLIAGLGGVRADAPSPLDASADCRAGELAGPRALALVGLAANANCRCHELSPEDRWRLAIARALSTGRSPVVVDCASQVPRGLDLAALFLGLRDAGVAVYAITDDAVVAGHADRIVTSRNGHLVSSGPSGSSMLDRTRVIHELLRGMT